VGGRVVSLENSGGISSCAVSFWAITILHNKWYHVNLSVKRCTVQEGLPRSIQRIKFEQSDIIERERCIPKKLSMIGCCCMFSVHAQLNHSTSSPQLSKAALALPT
jgi:hypothetical protein